MLFVYVSLQIITFSGAIGLQSNSACLVGHLHLAHMSTSHSHTAGRCSSSEWSLLVIVCLQNVCDFSCPVIPSVPLDFSYLSEKSVIRSIIDFLTEAGKKGLSTGFNRCINFISTLTVLTFLVNNTPQIRT